MALDLFRIGLREGWYRPGPDEAPKAVELPAGPKRLPTDPGECWQPREGFWSLPRAETR